MSQPYNLRNAVVNFSNTGDNTVIAGVSGRVIKVFGYKLTFTTATNVIYKSNTTALSGTFDLQANGSDYELVNEDDVYICAPGEAFIINQSGTASVQGYAKYQLL